MRRRQRPKSRLARLASTLVLVAGLACLYFVGDFIRTFELLGLPVHSAQHGWLGPTPRDASRCVVDAGKVNSWECKDVSVFERHRHGCALWLRVFGYGKAT